MGRGVRRGSSVAGGVRTGGSRRRGGRQDAPDLNVVDNRDFIIGIGADCNSDLQTGAREPSLGKGCRRKIVAEGHARRADGCSARPANVTHGNRVATFPGASFRHCRTRSMREKGGRGGGTDGGEGMEDL